MKNKEIRGIIASTGRKKEITGRVRVVTEPLENQFANQEILVAQITRVGFVPIMKKAKAVITDRGGMICHAAIISRELKIPCIVGTRDATQMLENGDLVKIDLEKGTVVKKEK